MFKKMFRHLTILARKLYGIEAGSGTNKKIKELIANDEDLIRKAAAIIEHLGSGVAGPSEAREQLGLS